MLAIQFQYYYYQEVQQLVWGRSQVMFSLIWAPVPLWNYVGHQSPNKATKPLVRQSVEDWVAEGIYHDASDPHLFYHERWIRIDSFPYQENEVGGPADYERT